MFLITTKIIIIIIDDNIKTEFITVINMITIVEKLQEAKRNLTRSNSPACPFIVYLCIVSANL